MISLAHPAAAGRHDVTTPDPGPCRPPADTLTADEGIECDESGDAGDPSTWPAWTDKFHWAPTEPGPAPGPDIAEHARDFRPGPDPDDRAWFAELAGRRPRATAHAPSPSARCTAETDGPGLSAFGHHA